MPFDEPDRFKHDRSAYERPIGRFRCGRESRWEKPCPAGPTAQGRCGGTRECLPYRNPSGRFECRRPASAGGPCPQGPLPDGTCSQQHPPCQPTPTLRTLRGRLVWVTLGLVAAGIGTLWGLDPRGERGLNPLNPGPLSTAHAVATREQGCAACHTAHSQDGRGFGKALLQKADLSQRCLLCHAFEGPAQAPHNIHWAQEWTSLPESGCVVCHREHRGGKVALAVSTPQQCNHCHAVRVSHFSQDHPQFREDYPRAGPAAIRFDHLSHGNRHFQDPRVAALAPKSCAACHGPDSAESGRPLLARFDLACAACHQADIGRVDLTLFRLPELTEGIPPAALAAALGEPKAARPDDKPQPFEPVSVETLDALSAFLWGVDPEEPQRYTEEVNRWLLEMAQEGREAIVRLLEKHGEESEAQSLLAGLPEELVRQAARAWASNLEYEAPSSLPQAGWFAEGLEIRYRPAGHADPLVRRWVEWAAAAADSADPQAEGLRQAFLSTNQGPGRCMKCHTLREAPDLPPQVAWQPQKKQPHPLTRFSHAPHLNLLGKQGLCASCHQLNSEAKITASDFHPIRMETCASCHNDKSAAAASARADCLLCHRYHGPSFIQDKLHEAGPDL